MTVRIAGWTRALVTEGGLGTMLGAAVPAKEPGWWYAVSVAGGDRPGRVIGSAKSEAGALDLIRERWPSASRDAAEIVPAGR